MKTYEQRLAAIGRNLRAARAARDDASADFWSLAALCETQIRQLAELALVAERMGEELRAHRAALISLVGALDGMETIGHPDLGYVERNALRATQAAARDAARAVLCSFAPGTSARTPPRSTEQPSCNATGSTKSVRASRERRKANGKTASRGQK